MLQTRHLPAGWVLLRARKREAPQPASPSSDKARCLCPRDRPGVVGSNSQQISSVVSSATCAPDLSSIISDSLITPANSILARELVLLAETLPRRSDVARLSEF